MQLCGSTGINTTCIVCLALAWVLRDVREAMTEVLDGPEVRDTVLSDPGEKLHAASSLTWLSSRAVILIVCGKELELTLLFCFGALLISWAGRYIKRDPQLLQTIQQLRRAGKKTFLLTNSLWGYANRVMKFLFEDNRYGL